MQVLIVSYYGLARPYNSFTNKVAQAKETAFCMFAWYIPVYTDYVRSAEARHLCGEGMVYLLLTIVSISVLFALVYCLR